MTYQILPVILLGIITSYEDIQYGKVRNKLLLVFLVFNLVLLVLTMSGSGTADFLVYLRDVFVNTICALIAGYVLWKGNIWPPGDAKLFATFAFILPLSYYSGNYLPVFPSFALLINIFSVALVFVIVHIFAMLVSTSTYKAPDLKLQIAEKLQILREKWLEYLNYTLGMVSLFLFVNLVSRPLQQVLQPYIPGFSLLLFIMVFMFFHKLMAFIKGKNFIAVFFVVTLLFFAMLVFWEKVSLVHALVIIKDSIQKGLMIFILMSAINSLFISYLKISEEKKVRVGELSRKNVLTQDSYKEIRQKIEDFGHIQPQGLASEQIEKIKKKFPAEKEFTEYRTMGFAPTIFLGVLVTMYLKQSVLHLVLATFFRF